MMEVKLRIKEREYTSKDGEKRVSKEIKFGELGMEQFITVKKLYQNVLSKEVTKKDGTTFTSNQTMVEYNGEKVSVNISAGSVVKWNDIMMGNINVSKVEFESDGQVRSTYNYEAV